MKRVVCGIFGTIYYATILKDGVMSDRGRVDVTEDAIQAVAQHIISSKGYEEKGYSGYCYSVDGKPVNLIAYDASRYKLELIESLGESDGK